MSRETNTLTGYLVLDRVTERSLSILGARDKNTGLPNVAFQPSARIGRPFKLCWRIDAIRWSSSSSFWTTISRRASSGAIKSAKSLGFTSVGNRHMIRSSVGMMRISGNKLTHAIGEHFVLLIKLSKSTKQSFLDNQTHVISRACCTAAMSGLDLPT